jgi:hypothetical protein
LLEYMKNMSSVSIIVYSKSLQDKNNVEPFLVQMKSTIKVIEFKVFNLYIYIILQKKLINFSKCFRI